MRRAQAIRKSRETVRRDGDVHGRCKGWVERLQSQQGRRAGGRGGGLAWGVLLWMLVVLAEGGGCIASAWIVV